MTNVYMVGLLTTIFSIFISPSTRLEAGVSQTYQGSYVVPVQQNQYYGQQNSYPAQPNAYATPTWGNAMQPQGIYNQPYSPPKAPPNASLSQKEQKKVDKKEQNLLNTKYTRGSNFFFADHELIAAMEKEAKKFNSEALNVLERLKPVFFADGSASSSFLLEFNQHYAGALKVTQMPIKWRGVRTRILDDATAQDLVRTLGLRASDERTFKLTSKKMLGQYQLAVKQKIKNGKEIIRKAFTQAITSNDVENFLNKLATRSVNPTIELTFGEIIARIDPNFVTAVSIYSPQMSANGLSSYPPQMNANGLSNYPPQTSLNGSLGFSQNSTPLLQNQSISPYNTSGWQSGINNPLQQGYASPFATGMVDGAWKSQLPPLLQGRNNNEVNKVYRQLAGLAFPVLRQLYDFAISVNLLSNGDPLGNSKIIATLSQGNQQTLVRTVEFLNSKGLLNGLNSYEKAMFIARDSFTNN